MSYHRIYNANGVQSCLRYEPTGEVIGKSCLNCLVREGEIQTIDGLVVMVCCSNRKMHEAPTVKPNGRKANSVETSPVGLSG